MHQEEVTTAPLSFDRKNQVLNIEHNGLDLALIAPACGPQYSPNLYQWLRSQRNKRRAWAMRVYRQDNDTLWIGILDGRELIGSRLMAVLCHGMKETTMAYQGIDAVEVPGFWARYTATGRCAFDTDHSMHFINDESRWAVHGEARDCQWCGNHSQTFKRWTESVERERWEAASAA